MKQKAFSLASQNRVAEALGVGRKRLHRHIVTSELDLLNI
jgi:hypothetical protein